MPNPLAPVLASYKAAWDALDVIRLAIGAGIALPTNPAHVFHTQTDAEKLAAVAAAKIEVERLGMVSLVATFERTLRDHLDALPVVAGPATDPLHTAVRSEIIRDMEMWNISSRVIELFAAVAPAVRGQVKQIIKYRNWVAHGRTLIEPPPIVILPPAAHQRLTDFLTQADILP